MKHIYLLFPLLLFITSCTKKQYLSIDNLVTTGNYKGVIRVECASCSLEYQLDPRFTVTTEITDQVDIQFKYDYSFDLKTEIVSFQKQKIRLLVIDHEGKVVYNTLRDIDGKNDGSGKKSNDYTWKSKFYVVAPDKYSK